MRVKSQTIPPAQIIISLGIISTRIVLLQAHPQVIYCNCVKFHLYWLVCFGVVALIRNMHRRTDRAIPIYPPKLIQYLPLFIGLSK